jgi:signal transduction histidine kinase
MASTRHLNFMVEQILTYSHLEESADSLAPEELDPEALARDVTSILEHEAQEKDLTLRVETEDGIGTFVTDPDKLRQVLMNLVQNAVKFTEEGEVVVTVSRGEEGEAVFEVRDTGVGIDPEDQKRIFNRFEKATRRHPSGIQSTGLGLAIVSDLTRRLGGEIDLESEPGQGSVFRVRVPPAPEARR